MKVDPLSNFAISGATKKPALKEPQKAEPAQKTLPLKDRLSVSVGEKSWQNAAPKVKGCMLGPLLLYGQEVTGLETYSHEMGHALTVKTLFEGANPLVQADGLENVRNFIQNPSSGNLKRMLTMYDANWDGAAGYTMMDPYGNEPNALGRLLGTRGSMAAMAAAGSVGTQIPTLAGFALGYKMRKKHPVLGYMLMSMTSLQHTVNSLYPLSAALMSRDQLFGNAFMGHDWARFAALTGIPPVLTAALFALSLPALGAGLYFKEKHSEEEKQDRLALSRLIAQGKISEQQLNQAFNSYPGAEKIKSLESKLDKLYSTPVEQLDKKAISELKQLNRQLKKEYEGFSGDLIKQYPDQVKAEKADLKYHSRTDWQTVLSKVMTDLETSYRQDKIGTLLQGAGYSAGILTAASVTLQQASRVAGNMPALITASRVAGSLIPVLGLMGTAGLAYQAGKVIKSKQTLLREKVSAAGLAAFSALGTAGLCIPGGGFPLTLLSLGGIVTTYAARWLVNRINPQ